MTYVLTNINDINNLIIQYLDPDDLYSIYVSDKNGRDFLDHETTVKLLQNKFLLSGKNFISLNNDYLQKKRDQKYTHQLLSIGYYDLHSPLIVKIMKELNIVIDESLLYDLLSSGYFDINSPIVKTLHELGIDFNLGMTQKAFDDENLNFIKATLIDSELAWDWGPHLVERLSYGRTSFSPSERNSGRKILHTKKFVNDFIDFMTQTQALAYLIYFLSKVEDLMTLQRVVSNIPPGYDFTRFKYILLSPNFSLKIIKGLGQIGADNIIEHLTKYNY